jgi:uncharacterized protein
MEPMVECPSVDTLEFARSILLSDDPDINSLDSDLQARFGLSAQDARDLLYATVLQINSRLFPSITQVELVHTEGCNLACTYCFEKDMLGYRKMPSEVARAAIDLLFDYSGHEPELHITHFGGEPTLNFAGIRSATDYAEARGARDGKAVKFDITTNGFLLNQQMLEYFAAHEIMVLLSLDGLQPSHDRFRIDKRGRGTFARVLQALTLLKTTQPWIGVKMTVMPQNVARLFEDALGLYQLGVNEFIIGYATGVPWSDDEITEYGTQLKKLVSWYREGARKDLRIREFDEEDNGPYFGCQAGRSSIAVTVDGQVSPCSKIMGFSSTRLVSKLGDVWNGLTHIRNRMNIVGCEQLKSACVERGLAAEFRGGCFAVNYGESGDLYIPSLQEHAFSLVKRSACSGCAANGRS